MQISSEICHHHLSKCTGRLDYCNSLLRGIKDQYLYHLQGIQNTLCRIITGASRYTSNTPHLRSLRWLPIKYGIVFKTFLLVIKVIKHSIMDFHLISLNCLCLIHLLLILDVVIIQINICSITPSIMWGRQDETSVS